MTVTIGAERIDMVRKKADEWARQLVDLGPRNSVLYFKNTKTASLDLTNADKNALAALLSGKPTRLSTLISDEDSHRVACQQVRSCARKIAAFEEEQGIQVGKVAQGLVNVPAPNRRPGATLVRPLRAPLLLRTVHIAARSLVQNDFVLSLDDDTELNPVLRHALDQVYGLDIPEAFETTAATLIRDADDMGQLPEAIYQSLAQIVERQRAVISLEPAIVVGLFHYEKLPMVDDLQQATELLATHDVVAALAGCQEAMGSLLADDGEPVDAQQMETLDPQDEFLVQDADSSQHQAIMAALAGRNILIEGPPGTGKIQTIANIIAGASAAGKRVLFVAEKRAAIEAVTDRLARAGLADLVFDLHRQRLDPRQAAAQLQASLEAMAQQQPVDAGDLHRSLRVRRAAVRTYPDELHTRREPWGISAFEAQAELLATRGTRSRVLFRGPRLQALDSRTVADLEAQLQEFVDLGGPRILRHESPWCWANVRDEQDISRVLAELDQLTGRSLHQGQQGIHRLVSSAGLPVPRDFAGWQAVLDLLDRVHRAVHEFGPSVFGQELDAWWCATGPRAARAGFPGGLTFSRRRALVKQVRSASTAGVTRKTALHDRLTEVRSVRDYWRSVGGQEVRAADTANLQHMTQMFAELRTQLASVAMCARIPDMSHQPTEHVDQKLQALRADQKTLWRMPKITELTEAFERLAVLDLVEDAARSNLSASATRLMFRRAWLESVLDQIRLDSPALREFVADRQNRLVEEFQTDDRKHHHAAAQRVRRAVAVGARRARDEHPEEAQLLKAQAAKKARHLSIRRLVEKAPHVLLALRPCWAMSPLVVSKVLPVMRLFDLVVFDEASQIKPNDAIASIARGRSVVVAGDDKQLPPTNFFDRMLDGSDENDDDGETSELQNFESILTRMRGLLQRQVTLRWHYRSRDERLISFANQFVYSDHLVTFPGAFKDTPVTLDVVDGVASPGQDGSAPEEIRQVVRRVIEHIEQRPHESLGVITMGQKHMDRVEREIGLAARGRPDLQEFLNPDNALDQRFFVKNLERVQGDERDAIILTIGVAKRADGRVARTGFGPLNSADGRRRLNVAVTRAKRRMTVVSSFGPQDLAPSDDETGTELLRRYLEFAQNDGDLGRVGATLPLPPNGFERDVEAALAERGIPVHAQWGFSDYRIDFALAHRDHPGRMVLAVECDGDSYHRAYNTRDRDRLRQSHLENLGWWFHRVWASAWFADRAGETDRIASVWEKAMIDADREIEPEEVVTASQATQAPSVQRGPRPNVPPGLKSDEYTDAQLIAVCRWLLTDRLQLDRVDRVDEALHDLEFKRRGSRIVPRLQRALEIAQQQADRNEEQR